ncbi:MAG: ABC transporter permease [Thermoplasmata archaeon]|nr:ABC transporter permease [Thermoplasmata archaeon]
MGLKDFIIKRTVYSIVTLLIVLVLLFTIFRVMPGDPTKLALDPKASPERKHIQAVQYGLEDRADYTVEDKTIRVTKDPGATIFTPLTPGNFVNSTNELRYTVNNPREEWFILEIKIKPQTPGLMVSAGVFLDGLGEKDGKIDVRETVLDVGNKTPWLAKAATNGNVLLGAVTFSDQSKLQAQNNTIKNCDVAVNSGGLSIENTIISDAKIFSGTSGIRNSVIIGTTEEFINKSTITNEVWYYNVNITGRDTWAASWGSPEKDNNSVVAASMLVGKTTIKNSNITSAKIFDSFVDNCTFTNVIVINSTINNRTAENLIILNDEEYPLDRTELILKTPPKPALQARGNDKNLVVVKLLTLNKDGDIKIEIKVTSYIRTDFFTQLARYMHDMLVFNFGNDFTTQRPVAEGISIRIGPTVLLFGSATIIAYALGIFLGALLAWRRGSRMELSVIIVSLFFYSMPLFWFGMILIWVFSNQAGWFPPGGLQSPTTDKPLEGFEYFKDIVWHLSLPLLTLTVTHLAGDILLMRNSMLEVMGEDYILTAKGKGLKEKTILYKHAARNAMLPVVTALALSIGGIVSGGVLTETVFSWPGMGHWLVEATLTFNYPVAQGVFYILAILTIVGNVMADILYAYLDPRVRL